MRENEKKAGKGRGVRNIEENERRENGIQIA